MTETAKPSAFAPFAHRAFAILWTATLVANIGTWFRDVANGWTMIELAPSATMVALVQAATTLPVFLFSLPAGALADLVDRRALLIWIQVFLAAIAATLALTVGLGLITPWLLLGLTFAAGCATALMGPAWQSIVPELVPKPVLRPAIALNSLGINIGRAIGPALGGLVVASAGAAVAYWFDVASYVLIIAALLWWRPALRAAALPPERFAPAMAAGLRYVLASGEMRRALIRAAAFFLFGSAYWALLPLIAKDTLGGDAALYGVLLTAIGAGAVAGALLLPRLGAIASPGLVVTSSTLLTAAAMAALALAPNPIIAAGALFFAGGAWIAALTTLNAATQTALPNWVRARGLAVYITVFFGAMTLGALAWGQAAQATSIPTALLIAAAGTVIAGLLVARVQVPAGDADLTPSMHWPEPATIADPPGERGPVLIQIEYRIAAENRRAFLEAIEAMAPERLRDGGYGWRVFEDVEDPHLFTEVFYAPSWLEHLRQHARVTKADAEVQAKVAALHAGPAPPRVRHFTAANQTDTAPPSPLPDNHKH